MEISRIGLANGLIVKCSQCPCETIPCSNIQSTLEECAHSRFSVCQFPCRSVSLTPELAVIQGCDATTVKSLRKQWGRSVLLGLFCPGVSASDVMQALRFGLDDFICCPFDTRELVPRLCRLLSHSEADRVEDRSCSIPRDFRSGLLGKSDCFVSLVAKLPQVAGADAICLLYGETGTGKELFARAIHYASPRRRKPFVPVNCGAVPDHLFENELFGHAKGAFTDASTAQTGLIAVAQGGTLFLDEVDALSPSAQVKLLRFLQDREYRPLGASQTVQGNVRIIAATNTSLHRRVQERSFREDLFHRLNVLSLTLPPLRERLEDIPVLAEHFLKKYGLEHRRDVVAFSPGALGKLLRCRWPGNVRELEGVIQRAVILSSSRVLQAGDIDTPAFESDDSDSSVHTFQLAKQQTLRSFERTYLTDLLISSEGNVSRAAKAAGKERRAFQRLMQKHRLARNDFRPKIA